MKHNADIGLFTKPSRDENMDRDKQNQADESEISLDTKPEKKNGKKPSPEKTIGIVLRDEREKKGLSYAQLSEITRLRPSFIEALEKEAWNDLPSPAFARGFICSYGRALGLDEEGLNELYRKSGPVKLSLPKPLAEPTKNKRVSLVIVVLILLSFMSLYFLWKGHSTEQTVAFVPTRVKPKKSIPELPEKIVNIQTRQQEALSREQIQTEPPPLITQGLDLIEETDPLAENEEKPAGNLNSTAAVENPVPELTLKAAIREETWVKITVDNNEPKEFMFTPGRRYEWKAKKGFELMIGNAGGIDLEFNGEAVAKPSTSGRVVRLRLPENFERTGF